MKYCFILGRNSELSKAEIFSYFEKEGIFIKIIEEAEKYLVIETEEEIRGIINNLGGTIAIGKVLFFGNNEEIKNHIKNKPLYSGNKNNFSFAMFNFPENEEILDVIKEKFRKEKLKAMLKHYDTPSKLKNIDSVYFLTKKSFGIVNEISDTKSLEKRDMNKPERRQELAISPRLAKILIELSGAKENAVLLDPFCGIGVILQEALLQKINVIGIDKDKEATQKAGKNIAWLKKKYSIQASFKILRADSRKIILDKIDAIATEPELGILLKEIPKKEETEKIKREFETLVISVFNNLKKYLKNKGRIAFTSPYIKTNHGRISCDIRKIEEATGLKQIGNGIEEFREEQIVGRMIFVLEKG